MSDPTRGFLLTPTYRVVRGVPEVHLYGVLESGEPCLVIDDRVRPYFYIPAAAVAQARRAAPNIRAEETALRTFDGAAVAEVIVAVPGDVPPLRQRLEAAGVVCLEADVRFAYRYLIDRGIRGAFSVAGSSESRPPVGRLYRNPELTPAHWVPPLRPLSIDIETSAAADRVYSIALHAADFESVLIVAGQPVHGAEHLQSEEALLRRFLACVRQVDPDIITGWNVVDFDLTVLQQRCRHYGLRCALGRTDDELEVQRDQSFTREGRAVLYGRLVLDGLSLVRGAFIKLDDYKLETAARTLLGKGKLFSGPNRHTQIEDAYRTAPDELAAYNLTDARLVSEILAATKLIDLSINRSLLTGMPLDRVSAAIASVDSLYLGEARRRGVVAPSVGRATSEARIGGGYVMESRPGLFRNILVFDFKSLYPSIIRTFNLDPLTCVAPGAAPRAAVVQAPNGACFLRQPVGILPELVARLAGERQRAKAAGDSVAANATKILMNSMYGVLGAGASRLFFPDVANAITSFGQSLIQRVAAWAREQGHAVIYGDTDSLFIDPHEDDASRAFAIATRLCAALNTDVADYVRREYDCESHLELEFEKLYHRFFMPEIRAGKVGSKKRYAGLLVADGAEEIEFVGLEAVRRDWTAVSKQFQQGLLDLVFHDRPVDAFVRDFVQRLRSGAFDALLTYKKAVRKDVSAYTKTTPPHVRAARRSGITSGIVEYVMTTAGPEPAGDTTAPFDYDHYVEHQLKPVGQAILHFLDRDFDELIDARRQLALF